MGAYQRGRTQAGHLAGETLEENLWTGAGKRRMESQVQCRTVRALKNPLLTIETTSARIRWAGHVERMADSRAAKQAFIKRPAGKRPTGCSSKRWLENIEHDLVLLTI